jgi:type II secretory pathway component PulF
MNKRQVDDFRSIFKGLYAKLDWLDEKLLDIQTKDPRWLFLLIGFAVGFTLAAALCKC